MARVGRSDTFLDTADVEPTSHNDDALAAAINRQRQENLSTANILRAALTVVCPSGPVSRDIPELNVILVGVATSGSCADSGGRARASPKRVSASRAR